MKKRIALFGATGKTGSAFLTQALEKGYVVKALARNPEKIARKDENLHVIKGDVLKQADVQQVVDNSDVVMSLFGHVKDSPKWLQTRGTQNIISSMKRSGVERIISLSGGGLPFKEKDKPKFPDHLIRFVMKIAVPHILDDAKKHHEELEKSGLKWTIVRGPRLTTEPKKGQYRVGWVGVNASTKIGREDLSDFLLKQVEDETFVHKMPFVSY